MKAVLIVTGTLIAVHVLGGVGLAAVALAAIWLAPKMEVV